MNKIVRCVVEAVGCVAVSGLALREYLEIKKRSSTAQRVNSGTAQFVDQSNSLTAEFYDILALLDRQFLARLEECFRYQKQGQDRVIRDEDLEEFTRNICSVDDSFLSEMVAPSSKFHERRPSGEIDEQYRLIPKDVVRKLVDLSDRSPRSNKHGGSSIKDHPNKNKKEKYLFGNDLNNELVRTLDLIFERRRIVLDLSYDFDLQQSRIEKNIKVRAGELYEPKEAGWDLRLMLLLQYGSYAVFKELLDRYWPVEQSAVGSAAGSASKQLSSRWIYKVPLWRAGLLVFPLVSALHYFMSSVTPMFFDDEIGFEERDLVQDALSRSAGVEGGASAAANNNSDHNRTAPPATTTTTTTTVTTDDNNNSEAPIQQEPVAAAGHSSSYGQKLFGDDDKEEDEVLVSVAAPPAVWPGATKDDPFAPSRLIYTLIEKPIMDEIMFRGVLFARLVKVGGGLGLFGGAVGANLSTIAYAAAQMRDGNIDLRAVGMSLTKDEAFVMNLLYACSAQFMYMYTGRLIFPILLNCGVSAYYLVSEFSHRGDFVHEKLWLWMPLVRTLGTITLFDSWVSEYVLRLRRYTSLGGTDRSSLLFPDVAKVTEKGGRPTGQVIQLADRIMETFSTVDMKNPASGTANDVNARATDRAKDLHQKVLLPTDIEDLIMSLQHATVVADKRHISLLSMPERFARKGNEIKLKKVSHWEEASRNISSSGSGTSEEDDKKTRRKNTITLKNGSTVSIDSRSSGTMVNGGLWVRPRADSTGGDGAAEGDFDDDLEDFISLNPRFVQVESIAAGVTSVFIAQVTSAFVQLRYPRGMDIGELRMFLMMELSDTTEGFRGMVDFADIDEIVTKWDLDQDREVIRTAYRHSDVLNIDATAATTAAIADEENAHYSPAAAMKNPTSAEFLDFMQLYYTAVLQETEELARSYAGIKGAEFADLLAGRRVKEEDIKRYQSALLEFLTIAKRRVAVRVLSPHGLSVRRFYRLMKMREDRGDNEVKELRLQWEQYFMGPLYRKRLFDLVEPSQFETPLHCLDALKARDRARSVPSNSNSSNNTQRGR